MNATRFGRALAKFSWQLDQFFAYLFEDESIRGEENLAINSA